MSIALAFALAHFSTFYWERPWIELAKTRRELNAS